MTWSRRQFTAALGLTPLLACDRGTRNAPKQTVTQPGIAPTVTEPTVAPTKPSMHYQPAGPGYLISDGPAPLAFDGTDLLEIRDGALIRRDASLAEVSRLPLKDVTSFAVLRDRSLVVRVDPADRSPQLHHVIAGKSAASYDTKRKHLAPTEKPNELWQVDPQGVDRDEIGTNKEVAFLLPVASHALPNGTSPEFAALADGTLAISNMVEILHADAKTLARYAFDGACRHLAPGPEPRTLWINDNFRSIVLARLEGTTAKVIARHALPPGETILHLAGSGDHAVVVIAQTTEPAPTVFELAAYTVQGERWRVPLTSPRQTFFAALSATRVVVRAGPQYLLRAWDLATGKPA